MLSQFLQTVHDKSLFSRDENLLLAVSGGVDSVVLAHLLKAGNYRFSIAHCNFRLRGREANADEKFVKSLAGKLSTPFFSTSFDTKSHAKTNKLSVQMAARELRYTWFRMLMQEHDFDLLLTAHHQDDNVETVLLNLTRGTGIRGLTGIPMKENRIVRPLLNFSRIEIEGYAKQNKIRFRNDSSNYEEKYARNLIRSKVIPSLRKINPSLGKTFSENIERFIHSSEIIDEVTEAKKNAIMREENAEVTIDIAKLKQEKHSRYFLFEILSEYGFQSSQLPTATEMLNSPSGKSLSSDTHVLITGRNELIIRKKEQDDRHERLPEFTYEVKENAGFQFPNDKRIACFDLEKMGEKMLLRRWRQGDRFRPFGMKGSKKLSDFFVNEKMSLFEKHDAWVLEADGRIAWIVGRRISDEFAVTEQTKKILVITLK